MKNTTLKHTKFRINPFFKKILLTFIIISPIGLYFGLSYYNMISTPSSVLPWVSWSENPSNSVYVCWETPEKTIGNFLYGTNENNLSESIMEPLLMNIHHLNVTGLIPDTKYYYKVLINGSTFGSGSFHTAPDDSLSNSYTDFNWVMTSDTQQPKAGNGGFYRIADAVENKNYSFMVDIGDLVDNGANKEEYDNFFETASAFTNTIPLIPVMGNHDMHGNGTFFKDYFINQVNNSAGQFFYSFNYSSVHFTICHFTFARISDFTQTQMNWIKQDLNNSRNMPFRIVMFHCPILGAGFFGRNQNLIRYLLPILQEYNVTATISGHEHHFERGHIGNMMYMTLGGGGGALDPGLRPQPETEIMTATPSYTEVHATANTLTFQTMSPEGMLIDNYTIHSGETTIGGS